MTPNKTIQSLPLAKEILKRGYCVRISTFGRSMFPMISSIVQIEPAKAEDIRAGDIVVYTSEERMVAHRLTKKIIKDGKKTLLVKGDTWLRCRAVLPEDVIGKVIEVEKWGIQINLKKGVGRIIDIICRSMSPLISRLYTIMKNAKHWLARKNQNSF